MKPLPLPLVLAFALLGICPKDSASSEAATASPPESDGPHWMVRVEVLMAALPQEDALALSPYRWAPHQDDATRIFAAVVQKKAILTGYALVQTLDGKNGRSETFLEKRYPTIFQRPLFPSTFSTAGNFDRTSPPTPVAFDIRNVGPSLDVTPTVDKAGDFIRLKFTAQRVDFLGFDDVHVGFTSKWGEADIAAPVFSKRRDTSTIYVRSGEHVVVGFHPLSKPDGYCEFFILQAVAWPVK